MGKVEEFESVFREAEEVGCYGLVEGVANNLNTHQSCYANEVTKKDGPFYCPECFSDAVIRKCTVKRDHFAHKTRLSPIIGKWESELHKKCKDEICQELSTLFPEGNWCTERPIPANEKHKIPLLIPDISGRINGVPIAIEIQTSALTIPKLVKKTVAYSKRKISVLWLVPLREELGELPFRPRLYERYLHSMYFGRTYYWFPGNGIKLNPVHYSPAKRFIEYSEWFDENGDHQEAGNYEKFYKIIKHPKYGPTVNIAEHFSHNLRKEFIPKNERLLVPECTLWMDGLDPWWDKNIENDFDKTFDISERYFTDKTFNSDESPY